MDIIATGFRFLELPPEIRVQIYTLLLTSSYRPGAHECNPGRGKPGLTASILRVSRRLYSECSTLLYDLNVFQAHPALLASLPFMTEISRPILNPVNSSLIKRYYIEVRLDSDPFWNGYDLKKAFSRCRELHVVSWQASFGNCGLDNLFPFVHVRGIGKARVEGSSVSPEFGRWLEVVMESEEDEWTDGMGLSGLPEYHIWDQGNR